MRPPVLFVLLFCLSAGTGLGGATEDPLRSIEVSELGRVLDPTLLAQLDASPRIAGRAALAVGRTRLAQGAVPLRSHLDARDPGERAMVVYALGLLADGASLDRMRALARADENSAVRYAALDALGRTVAADPALAARGVALDILIVARSDRDAAVRAHAAAQLETFHKEPYAAEIASGLEGLVREDPDPAVRWHAAWAIFRGYATVADRAYLKPALRDRDELVRVETLRAWGRRSDPDAASLVRPLLRDPSWRVQLEAAEALRRLAKQPPTEHLLRAMPGLHLPPPGARSAAVPPVEAAAGSPAAPAPADFPLPAYARLPTSAAEMNGPAAGVHPRVLIATTKGDVVVKLYPEWAPSTVANFIALAQRGYFDGNRWFRIVPDFVVQTGDPSDNGEGDAGYSIPAEENPVEQRAGIIAMGLNYKDGRAIRDSAGTQFYVTLSPQLHLDRDFTVFGEIESGTAAIANLVESDRIRYARLVTDL